MPITRSLILATGLFAAAAAHAETYDDLLKAMRNNEQDAIVSMVRQGMDVNSADPDGTTILMYAARFGDVSLTQFLLSRRAKVDAVNRFGDSALKLAALGGHKAVVEALLAAGASTEAKDWSPLMYAAFNGHLEVVRALLRHGANVDALSANHSTALMLAARNGHEAVVRQLLDSGADTELKNIDGMTASAWALKNRNTDIAVLIEKVRANPPQRMIFIISPDKPQENAGDGSTEVPPAGEADGEKHGGKGGETGAAGDESLSAAQPPRSPDLGDATAVTAPVDVGAPAITANPDPQSAAAGVSAPAVKPQQRATPRLWLPTN